MRSARSRDALRRSLGLVWLTLAACGQGVDAPGTPSDAADRPRTVRALMSHDPPSLSLIGKVDRNSEILAAQITDALLQYDERMRLQPRVADNYTISEDRLTLRFELRSGVRWHDGREVTAEDVVFSVEQARDPAVENRSFAPLFRDLVSIEAVDERTVRFAFDDDFERGERYKVRVIESAKGEAGLELQRPFELRFSTVGYLEVTNTLPADGATEIMPDTVVTVLFNRPVVPLSAIEDIGNLPHPLTFVPPVRGSGVLKLQ